MIRTIQQRFALSQRGARDFCRGALLTTLLDLMLMLPALYVFLFLDDYLRPILAPGSSPQHDLFYYTVLGLTFLAVMYGVARAQYRSTYTSVYDESAARRIALAEKLRKLPLAFFGEKNLSDLTATIMEDCTDLEHTFSHAVPQLCASLLSLLLVAVGMGFYNLPLTLALFWVVPVAILTLLAARRQMRRGNTRHYRDRRAVSEHIQEGLEAVQEIKAYHREADYEARLDRLIDADEKAHTRSELLTGMLVHGAQSLLKLGLATVILLGAHLLQAGRIELFPYLVFLIIGSRVYNPISEVLNNLAALSYLNVRIRRMREIEQLPTQQGSTRFEPQGYDIEFRHVDFAYDNKRPVLHDVSFTARQGAITALVGPSGSGKSTAARLAARFWDATNGQITLGGTDIAQVDPETLLRSYAIVFQDVVLFNASVLDNIRIGRRDASNEEVMRAARLAQCDEFVSRLPQGYDTLIGENGEKLSGGERQRISIARALLKDAPVVLLDEATASLDADNETRIQQAIGALVRQKTVLIIAHRLRTVAHADHIVVLHEGRVAEDGTPRQLLAQDGLFAHMARRQMQQAE